MSSLRDLRRWFFSRRSTARRWRAAFSRRKRELILEALRPLEKRQLLTTYTVTSAANSGTGTLRDAITQANSHANSGGPDVINFNVTGTNKTITLSNFLPTITDSVTIDATSQPGYAVGTPVIELTESTGAPADATAFTIAAPSVTIAGFSIYGFNGNGITVQGDLALIFGNNIGVKPDGTTVVGNGTGIYVQAANVTIGGGTAAQRNIISGNANGIDVDTGSTGGLIQNNYIGTDKTGALNRGNASQGIVLSGIGGTVQSNVISGNGFDGINICT